MSTIPLDVQRRCERRWAARFFRPTESVASRKQGPKRETQQIAGPDKSKRKTRRREPAAPILRQIDHAAFPAGPRVVTRRRQLAQLISNAQCIRLGNCACGHGDDFSFVQTPGLKLEIGFSRCATIGATLR
jgi:hypothetical protein